jgi:hypothetical protein
MDCISCPFCNAVLGPELLSLAPGGNQIAKIVCPRCGEPIPRHLAVDPSSSPREERRSSSDPHVVTPLGSPRWTNRQIGFSILGVMFLMAVLGLTWALWTVNFRRQNDYGVKRNIHPSPPVAIAGELTGLGYLPPDVNVVAAVRVADLLKDAAGRDLLAPPRPAILDLLLGAIEKWTKLTPSQLDHIVVGTDVGPKFPQITLVVHTREPLAIAELAKALHPYTPTVHRGLPLFRFSLHPGEGMLWRPQPNTLILLFRLDALKIEDLDAIPLSPRQGTDAPPPAVREIVAERIGKQSPVWIAGRVEDSAAVGELLSLAPLPNGVEQFLKTIQAFGLSLAPQTARESAGHEELALTGYFRATGGVQPDAVRKQLELWNSGNLTSFKVAAAPANLTGSEAQWVSLQIRGDAQSIRRLLGQHGNNDDRHDVKSRNAK